MLDGKLVLDGAMGTVLQKYNLEEKSFLGSKKVFEILNLTEENIIKEIHRKYFEAGADIIETNTFNCNFFALEGTGLEEKIFEICKRGAELAKEIAQEHEGRLVAGAIGPTSMMLSQNMERVGSLRKSYREQIGGIIAGGVDFLLFETVYDYKNLRVALEETKKMFKEQKKKPIVISFTCDDEGKIYSGERIEKIIEEIDRDEIIGYGINCVGKNSFIERMKDVTYKKIFFYPNSNILKEIEFERYFKELVEKNRIDVLGGCCGTDFNYIYEISKIMKKKY